GYYTNAPMWVTGPACSQASDCTTYSNSGCSGGLCTKGADIPVSSKSTDRNEIVKQFSAKDVDVVIGCVFM
ncbi:hypothetical protein NECAME_18476, partial [Necator americanus]